MTSSDKAIRLARLDDLRRKRAEVEASGFTVRAEDPREALMEMIQARAEMGDAGGLGGAGASSRRLKNAGGDDRGERLRKFLAQRGGGQGQQRGGQSGERAGGGELIRKLLERRQGGGGGPTGGGAGAPGADRPMLRRLLEARGGEAGGGRDRPKGDTADDQEARRERLKRLLTVIKKGDRET